MFNRDALAVLLEKVPDLRSPWRLLLTVVYTAAAARAWIAGAVDAPAGMRGATESVAGYARPSTP